MEQKTIRIDARVEPSLWEDVKAYAAANDLSASQVLRKALRAYLLEHSHG